MSSGDLTITVLFQNGARSVHTVSRRETVASLIDRLKSDPNFQSKPDQVPRLLFLGRILQPNNILSSLSDSSEFTVQCIAQRQPDQNKQECESEPAKGFDRLLRVGYTSEQIAELRSAFHTVSQTSALSHEAQLDLEDEWVPALALEGSPTSALRAIRVMNEHSGRTFETRTIAPIEMPVSQATESESPLLRMDEESEPVDHVTKKSWLPFGFGVLFGLLVKSQFFFAIPIAFAINPSFAVGMIFGMSLRAIYSAE